MIKHLLTINKGRLLCTTYLSEIVKSLFLSQERVISASKERQPASLKSQGPKASIQQHRSDLEPDFGLPQERPDLTKLGIREIRKRQI